MKKQLKKQNNIFPKLLLSNFIVGFVIGVWTFIHLIFMEVDIISGTKIVTIAHIITAVLTLLWIAFQIVILCFCKKQSLQYKKEYIIIVSIFLVICFTMALVGGLESADVIEVNYFDLCWYTWPVQAMSVILISSINVLTYSLQKKR